MGRAAWLLPLLASCSSPYMRDAEPAPDPAEGQAKVVIYRPSARGNRPFPVHDGDRFLGFAEPRGAFGYLCPPGPHLFIVHGTTDAAVEADLAAGKTYFLQVRTETDWLRRRVLFVPVVAGSKEAETLEADLAACASRALDADLGAEFAEGEREEAAAMTAGSAFELQYRALAKEAKGDAKGALSDTEKAIAQAPAGSGVLAQLQAQLKRLKAK